MSKILICEDDQGIIEVIKTILDAEGYETVCYTSCKEVDKLMAKEKPDMILLDLWMPDMDGEAIIKHLQRNEQTKTLPVVIVSATGDVEKTAERYGVDFLRKPFHIDDLLSKVKTHLPLRATPAST